MHQITQIKDDLALTPANYEGHSTGFRQQILISRELGSPHMTLSVGHLDTGGHVETQLHSFEVSLYVFSGKLAVTTLGKTTLLEPDHCMCLPLATSYSLRALDGPVKWLQMASPAELTDGRRQDTFFTGEVLVETTPELPDMRDPRNRNAVRFDSDSMDLKRLAGGADVNAPTVSPSMATALLAYSGIGVKMLIDQQVGAQLHTMFIVDYQPTAIAHPHDHPFEEAYVFVEGEVHALVDGELMVFHPGDVLWAGVGADHGFENRSSGLVRWIEVQAPQPPSRHSYRFSREWEHLAAKLQGLQ
ncbi:MAG TPA: cupin domain-containing protein [Acidimicrobiales bacterium]|nr:cupin domain-containing protein [Acidimicrobiales bacterium]